MSRLTIQNPKYYVGVQTGEGKDYHLTLITETDNVTKTWRAYNSEKPKEFSKELAEELVMCLAINDTFAVVVESAGELTGQPFIKH